MKNIMHTKLFALLLCGGLMSTSCEGKSKEVPAVQQVIRLFAEAGDKQDVSSLEGLLDPSYRIVMNQLFGSAEVNVMDRSTYLGKIASKEFGGDKRTVKILSTDILGNTAVVKVVFAGEKLTFTSQIQLVKNAKGEWKLISDTPTMN
jgi:Putative lumazine-binding